MIRFQNVNKSFGSVAVLKNINFELPDVGMVMITGPSGSGKSTILNLIGHLDIPTNGKIIYNGLSITNLKKKAVQKYLKEEISFIFQDYNLVDYLNVEDNLRLVNRKSNTLAVLKQLKILNIRNRKISNISGGERQRVAIARAINSNSKIILCDEPTGALDTNNSSIVIDELKKISSNKLVVVVTHNLEYVSKYADIEIRVRDGEIVEYNIYKNYNNHSNNNNQLIKNKNINIIKIVRKHLHYQKKRTTLTIIAMIISLLSLAITLALSSGFKQSIDTAEKESLSMYPLYISKNSYNITKELNENIKTPNPINDQSIETYEKHHENILTKEIHKQIESLKKYSRFIIRTYLINNRLIRTYDNTDIYKELELLSGTYPKSQNDVLLITENKRVERNELFQIGLTKDIYDIRDLIGYTYKTDKKIYKITGIANLKEDSCIQDITGILYNSNTVSKNTLPIEYYIYPNNYTNRENIIHELNNLKDIEYLDYVDTFTSVSKTLIKGITIVLIVFSVISLIVSAFMITIITYISVIERTKEIGIYKALGFNNLKIRAIFYLENIFMSIVSCIITLELQFAISNKINTIIEYYTGLKKVLTIDLRAILMLTIISLIVTTIASYIPLKKINKLQIVDILKNNI